MPSEIGCADQRTWPAARPPEHGGGPLYNAISYRARNTPESLVFHVFSISPQPIRKILFPLKHLPGSFLVYPCLVFAVVLVLSSYCVISSLFISSPSLRSTEYCVLSHRPSSLIALIAVAPPPLRLDLFCHRVAPALELPMLTITTAQSHTT